jgi:hypothetical protein
MRCEEVLARSETGHLFDRWRARRHATRCAACAAALRAFEETKRLWAVTEPLSSKHQTVWKAAACQAATPARARYKARLAVAGFALAAGLLLVLFAWRPAQSPKNDNQREVAKEVDVPRPAASIVPVPKKLVAMEFAPLEQKLKALEHEIDALQASAEKSDAQFQLAKLIQQYSKREASAP